MDEVVKGSPGGAPPGAAITHQQLQHAISDSKLRSDLVVRLKVTGGLPSEATPFDLTVHGSGTVVLRRPDRRQRNEQAERSSDIEVGEVQELLRLIDLDDFALATQRRVPIPPDSLVGILEVQAGGAREQVIFMADEEQAKTEGFILPDRLKQLVRGMTQIGEKTVASDEPLLGSR